MCYKGLILTLIAVSSWVMGAEPILLIPGTFHEDEIHVPNKSQMLALCGKELRSIPVLVESVPDLADPEVKGLKVTAPCQAVVLISGIEGLKAGPVKPAMKVFEKRNKDLMGPGILLRQKWALSAGGSVTTSVEQLPVGPEGNGYLLQVKGEKPDSSTFQLRVMDTDNAPEILYAGDLNGDGQVDFIVRGFERAGVLAVRLILSTGRTGTLVEVAHFSGGGC